jgi:hypothetical protein
MNERFRSTSRSPRSRRGFIGMVERSKATLSDENAPPEKVRAAQLALRVALAKRFLTTLDVINPEMASQVRADNQDWKERKERSQAAAQDMRLD